MSTEREMAAELREWPGDGHDLRHRAASLLETVAAERDGLAYERDVWKSKAGMYHGQTLLADTARLEEREACAKLADEHADVAAEMARGGMYAGPASAAKNTGIGIAAAIRSRSGSKP